MKHKLFIIGLFFMVSCTNTVNKINEQKNTIDSLQKANDSLYSEIATQNIEIGRYEIIMDNLLQMYPKIYDTVSKNVE